MPTFTRASKSMLSPADLLAFAAKQSSSEASRYAHAAEVARARGNRELAQLLGILAERQPAAGEVNNREGEEFEGFYRRRLPRPMQPWKRRSAPPCSRLTGHWRWQCRRRKEIFAPSRKSPRWSVRRTSAATLRLLRATNWCAPLLCGGASPGLSCRTAERHAGTCHVAGAACVERNMEPVAGAPDEAKQLEQAFEKYLAVAEHARDEAVLAEAQVRAAEILHRMLRTTHAEASYRDRTAAPNSAS